MGSQRTSMTTPATPHTAAGRLMLTDVLASALPGSPSHDLVTRYLLAIEAEMYDLASNEGYHAGIADCKEHDPAHQAAAPDALREALDTALAEFDNILWDDIWQRVDASGEDELARMSRKYSLYVRDGIVKARAALAAEPEEEQE